MNIFEEDPTPVSIVKVYTKLNVKLSYDYTGVVK